MQQTTRTSYHRALLITWIVLRQVLGWFFILLGLVGLVLPVLQGVLFLVIGIALVGRKNWLIRRSTLVFKRFLRRWAAVQQPLIGGAGRIALRAQWKCSRESRHLHRRYAAWRQRRLQACTGESTTDADDMRYENISKQV
jgi:hypothetical protein